MQRVHAKMLRKDAPPSKRLKDDNTWKKVISKRRMVGKSYTGKQKPKDIMREAQAMGPRCYSVSSIVI